MDEIIATCKNIGVVVSCVSGIIALTATIVKPIRQKFINMILKHSHADKTQSGIEELSKKMDSFTENVQESLVNIQKQLTILTDGSQAGLAHQITSMYYENLEYKALRVSDWDALTKMYTAYKREGGNSFIDGLYDKMKDWDIIE